MLIVAWETTAECNLSCRYCRASASASPDPDELDTSEALAFIESIAPLQPMFILSGGEPLLRPDIFQIARRAVSLGLRVSMASNGTLLTAEAANKIAASGISRVSISLDGASAELHDQSRGQGSFLRALEGMKNLRGKIGFQINFTITRKNERDIPEFFALAKDLGAEAVHFFFLVPTGRGLVEDMISPERQEELLMQIDRERENWPLEVQVTCAPQYARISSPGKGRRSGGCLAGKRFVFISRKGDVYPCGYFPVRAGSIRENNFMDIWTNSRLLQDLREKPLSGKCGRCSFSKTCGGCRARAYAETGDYLGPDPSCSLAV
ncbi:Coenzyme PQQ synthesis protein E [uncultured archaeon]|nr:Coenzyme PQQ synthesis protein E [uncultured archaeon]